MEKHILTFLCLFSFALKSQNFDYYKYRVVYNKAVFDLNFKKDYAHALKNYQKAIQLGNKYLPNGGPNIPLRL